MGPANLSRFSFAGIEELSRRVTVTLHWNGVISRNEMQVNRRYGKRKIRYMHAEHLG